MLWPNARAVALSDACDRGSRARVLLWSLCALAACVNPLTAVPAPSTSGGARASDAALFEDGATGRTFETPGILQWQGEPVAPAGAQVSMTAATNADGGDLEVSLWLHHMEGLLGVAGQLQYDPNCLQFKLGVGDELAAATDKNFSTTKSLVKPVPAGRVLLGAARFVKPQVAPVDAFGPDTIEKRRWMKLRFQVVQDCDTTLGFDASTTLVRRVDGARIHTVWHGAKLQLRPGAARGVP